MIETKRLNNISQRVVILLIIDVSSDLCNKVSAREVLARFMFNLTMLRIANKVMGFIL